jgi:Zn-finger protein
MDEVNEMSNIEVERREVIHSTIPRRVGDRVIVRKNEVWECAQCRLIKRGNTSIYEITLRQFDGISSNAIRNR